MGPEARGGSHLQRGPEPRTAGSATSAGTSEVMCHLKGKSRNGLTPLSFASSSRGANLSGHHWATEGLGNVLLSGQFLDIQRKGGEGREEIREQ